MPVQIAPTQLIASIAAVLLSTSVAASPMVAPREPVASLPVEARVPRGLAASPLVEARALRGLAASPPVEARALRELAASPMVEARAREAAWARATEPPPQVPQRAPAPVLPRSARRAAPPPPAPLAPRPAPEPRSSCRKPGRSGPCHGCESRRSSRPAPVRRSAATHSCYRTALGSGSACRRPDSESRRAPLRDVPGPCPGSGRPGDYTKG